MKTTPAGEYRHTVVIRRPPTVETQDSTGQVIGGYETVTTAKAKIEMISARERFVAAQEYATATHRISMRYQPALDAMDASWIVAFGDVVYKLIGPKDNVKQRNREIVLLCEEGPPV
jgi:SPP1 family predicted phage head-tail adaptor